MDQIEHRSPAKNGAKTKQERKPKQTWKLSSSS